MSTPTYIHVDIESYDKVIISPKVIHGVDSKKERKVFAVYKEHTITAKHMIQQVNRCRNILHLYYYFPYKHYTKPKYQSLDEVIQEIEEQDKLYDFEVLTMLCTCNNGLDITAIFKQLYAMTLYEHDCVNTNKYLHFKNIMKERGIQDDKARVESKKLNLPSRNTLIQEKVQNFNVEELKAQFEEDGTVIMGKSNEVNDILQIPDEELNDYKQYLVDESLLQKHWQFCRFFISKDEKKKLDKALEFQCRKTISIKGKLYTLRHIINKFDITLNKGEQLTINNQNITDSERKDMLKFYKTSFRCPKLILNDIPEAESMVNENNGKTLMIIDDWDMDRLNKNQTQNLSKLFRYISSHHNISIMMSYQSFFQFQQS